MSPLPPLDPVDADTQPVVRPYALTNGRTRPAGDTFDLLALILAAGPASALGPAHSPERVEIVRLSQRPVSVAELAARLDLPLNVVRVVLDDLWQLDLISVQEPQPADVPLGDEILEALLAGLRAL